MLGINTYLLLFNRKLILGNTKESFKELTESFNNRLFWMAQRF